MTATTIPQGLGARSGNALLKITISVALMVVLAVGAFAVGRSTADDGAATTRAPSTDVYEEPDPDSCNHTAHTPPC